MTALPANYRGGRAGLAGAGTVGGVACGISPVVPRRIDAPLATAKAAAEHCGVDYDDSVADLRALLGTLAGRSPRAVVDTVISRLTPPGQADDDVVVLAMSL